MKKLIQYNLVLFLIIVLTNACEKSENSSGAPTGKINSITAYYPGFDTLNLTDSSEIVLDTNGYLVVNFEFNSPDGLEQISGYSTGASANFDSVGFIKGFGSWGEDLKTSGFKSNTIDNFDLTITANSMQEETITFQIFGENRLYSDLNFQFKSVVDSTQYK